MKVFLNGFWAVAAKEALHIVRDRLTLALLITVPIVQLLLFGFAIDLHPKNLPTALVAHENDKFVDRAVEELEAVGYFKIVKRTDDLALAERWLATSRVQFILELPKSLGFQAVTGQQPSINLIVDASDPVASIIATQAAQTRYAEAAASQPLRIRLNIERRYNPDGASRLFIVPGLLGVVLTLTLVLLGAFSLVRERERGSFETMLLLPVPRAAILLAARLYAICAVADLLQRFARFAVARRFTGARAGGSAICRSQSRVRNSAVAVGAKSNAGNAAWCFLLSAVDAAIGLYVPISWYAAMGAWHRHATTTDPFFACGPRDLAKKFAR